MIVLVTGDWVVELAALALPTRPAWNVACTAVWPPSTLPAFPPDGLLPGDAASLSLPVRVVEGVSVPAWDPPLPLAIGALPTLGGEANSRLGHAAPTSRTGSPRKLMVSCPSASSGW
ncbi:hypothetical protein GCM10022225_06790 [Plantactinospora mayteni]|uniref:Secreted protein n=1 Tax=Plantactinospora mayteni TaxID=566021 RepID=A0ABQ4ER81_9ACTN|nr:hypothetical protein Pma05_37410 [Plantactinospora mayteni]